MKESQNLLFPYVKARINSVLTDKKEREIQPLIATENEIIADIRTDIMECMKNLDDTKVYRLTSTLNSPAMMPIKESNDEIPT